MKKIEQTRGYKKTKRFLKQLAGQDVWIFPGIKTEQQCFGDWCIDPTSVTADSIVYSIGIGTDVDFDISMIERFGVRVFGFDPTPGLGDWLSHNVPNPSFIFHPYGIASRDEDIEIYPRINKKGVKYNDLYSIVNEGDPNDAVKVKMLRLSTVMQQLGHDHIDILKMDVEAAEYEVIDDLLDAGVKIDQILVEFHHRFKSVGRQKTLDAVRRLNQAGYEIFFISDLGREYSFRKVR